MCCSSEEVLTQELGATLALCVNHVAARTLSTSGTGIQVTVNSIVHVPIYKTS